jgi:hypothetical protein
LLSLRKEGTVVMSLKMEMLMLSCSRSADPKASIHAADDSRLLTKALTTAQKDTVPYPHYYLRDVFDPAVVDELLTLPFEAPQHVYQQGTREEFNATRSYLNQETIQKFEMAHRVVQAFLAPETLQTIENMGKISLKGSFLRIEYAMDKDAFWLKPHTDLGVKLVTILLYLSKDADAGTWGTDLYQDEATHAKTCPYASNVGVLFFPSTNTWHGFEPRTIHGIRKSLVINYVTKDWQERWQLADAIQPVY